MFTKKSIWAIIAVIFSLLLLSRTAAARPSSASISTSFTYQGRLTDGGTPAEGNYDFEFKLYDASSEGNQIGSTVIKADVPVTDGLFIVALNFGPVFDGSIHYLEISVRPADSGPAYTVLDPRQPITAAPNAIFAGSASWNGLIDIPAGFADGVDNNTTYTAGNGLSLDGTEFKAKGTAYQNMIIVAKSGGDFTSIQAALDSIIDADVDNHYLVYVAPGVYNERVTMKEFVDIEGAGELATKITAPGLSSDTNIATLKGANNAELRFLTVESTGSDFTLAIINISASPRLTHVTASALGGLKGNYGIKNVENSSPIMSNVTVNASTQETVDIWGFLNYGILNSESSPTMNNVTVSASNHPEQTNEPSNIYGLWNYDSSVTMTNVNISVLGLDENYGVYNATSSVTMTNVNISVSDGKGSIGIFNADGGTSTVLVNNSQISASTFTIANWGSDILHSVQIGASQLSDGTVNNSSGTVTCIGVYDENYQYAADNGDIPGYTLCP